MARAVAVTASVDGGPNRAKSRYPAGVSKWAAYDVSTGSFLRGGSGWFGTVRDRARRSGVTAVRRVGGAAGVTCPDHRFSPPRARFTRCTVRVALRADR